MTGHRSQNAAMSRRNVLKSGVALGAAASFSGMSWAATPSVSAEMGKAASAWLKLLDDVQRRAAQLGWDDGWRENWHYTPRRRPGVALREMSEAQTKAAWDVLGTLLSGRGLDQVHGNLRIEKILGDMTGSQGFRDPGNYALIIFGDPAGNAPWGWRFEGHHLSLNVAVAPEFGVSVTPAFFGANPAKVPPDHEHAGFRLLGAEEDAAFSLIQSLEGDNREKAIIGNRSLGDIVSGPGREDALKGRYEGIALAQLNETQKSGVAHILELYAGTTREEIARAAMKQIGEAGLDSFHFAWAGSLTQGKPHYFRIHGPKALVEYDNTQNGANHVHSVWIDPEGVFGADLLKAHYRKAH